jgi:hypothetical protein
MRSYVWGDALKSFTNNAAEVFCGGHVRRTGDGGMLYDRWLQDPGLKRGERQTSSSHQSDYAQYEVIVPGRGVILVGCSNKYRTVNNKHTWFQNEAHAATEGFVELTLHGADFFKHKASGNQQVGALGYSPYSEKEGSNPLVCEGQLPLVIIRLTQS